MKGCKFIRGLSALPFFILTVFIITNCSSRDDDEPEKTKPKILKYYQREDPLNEFHTKAGFTQTRIVRSTFFYEQGLEFSPRTNGKIITITGKLPDPYFVRVTLWDVNTKTVIRTELINAAGAEVFKKDVDPIALEKDKHYLITMNTRSWYRHEKPDQSDAEFPVTTKTVQIWNFRYLGVPEQKFPTTVVHNNNGGDLSFIFQQTD